MGHTPIVLTVNGLPPAKSEAASLLGKHHPHIDRALALLEAAREAVSVNRSLPFTHERLRLDVTLYAPADIRLPDATNLLGRYRGCPAAKEIAYRPFA